MLIIEGTDLVGKSSLCDELIRRLWWLGYPIVYQHFGILPATWDYFEDYITFINKRTCMDRFIMSEVVYGTIARDYPKISVNKYRELDGYLRINQSVTVVVTALPSWLDKQIDTLFIMNRKEHYNKDIIMKANAGFSTIVNDESIYKCDFDFHYIINESAEMPSSDNEFINNVIKLFLERNNCGTLFKETGHLHGHG